MLCTRVESSCPGKELSECWSSLEMALHWSDILQLYPIRPDPTEHVELFRLYPTNANILQLTPTAGPHWPDCWRMLALVGECWRLSGQCGSCLSPLILYALASQPSGTSFSWLWKWLCFNSRPWNYLYDGDLHNHFWWVFTKFLLRHEL